MSPHSKSINALTLCLCSHCYRRTASASASTSLSPEELKNRLPGATHAASSSATEANAARNIEQSLQLLVEAIPLAGLRQAWLASTQPGATMTGVTGAGAARIPLIPTPKDLFDIAVERAEESILELLTAHKSVLGMNALYKCLTMIECVELYGALTPPAYAHSSNPASAEEAMHAMLSYAIALYSQSVASGAIRQMAGARLQRGASCASMLSLTSDASAAHSSASVAASTAAATTGRNQVVTNGQGGDGINLPPLSVLLGWLRLPAFSAHLHKTVLTLLLEAIHAHEQGGRHKFQYDVSKGEVTHLPAHILKHLKVELPLRLRCLASYTTIQELGAGADRTRAGYVRQHGAFNSFQAVNLRQLFDRTAPAAPLPPPPTAASTAASQFSLLGSMSPLVSTASTVPPSPYSSQTAATPVHGSGIAGTEAAGRHSIDDEVAALCKLSTPRAEAAMWALRAAQNAELQAARQAALAQAAQASAMAAIGGGGSAQRNASMETFGADRLASADSASSSTMSRAATQLMGGTSVRPGSLTPTGADHASMGGESGNSHSKVRRVVGKDAPLSPSVPSLSLDLVDTPTASGAPREPFFPTEYAKRSDTGRRSPQLHRARSRSSSSEAGGRLRDSTADDELHSGAGLSFSAFRAFHLAYGKAAETGLKHAQDATSGTLVRFFPMLDMSKREVKDADAHFRTNEVVTYVLRTEYAPNGTAWSQLRDHAHYEEGAHDPTLVRASGAGALRRFHSASSGLSGGSTPQGSGTPRQGSAQKSAAFGTPAAGPVVEANLAAITAAKLLQLPATPVESVTSAPIPTATVGVTGSQKTTSAIGLFTMLWCPTYAVPHALLHFLIAPLAGDIFSLTSLHEALSTMGIANKLVGLKHVAPLFCAHLARQPPEHLITEVLVKKLSTFPFQRWLRDSLLTFQDTLMALESAHSRGDGGKGAAPGGNSASSVARVSGEKDTSAAAAGASTLPSSDEAATMELSGTSGADAQWVYTLASEIRDVAASTASQADVSTAAQGSDALPSYDEFIR
jgi:hypothetical protein